MKRGTLIPSLLATVILATSVLAQSARLRPSSDYWDRNARHVPVHISHLSPNRRLAAVGDSLYMLNARNRIVWSWSSGGAPLTDTPVVDSKGTIYVIGYDLLWAALDSANGKEKWRGTANGRAVYTQIERYKKDMYLVVTDMGGYRDNLSDRTIEDNLTLCKGNAILWDTRIPAGAKIQVHDGRVFTVIRRKNQTLRKEVFIPRRFGKPIGKVSELAEYD
jgi:outer membrane protein assembly factor BamB